MKSPTTISLVNEPWLEKWARLFRFESSLPTLENILKTKKSLTLVDYGCGQDILYYKFLMEHFPQDMKRIRYIGIDPLIESRNDKNIEIIASRFEDVTLKQPADVAVMFAVLEHVDNPTQLLSSALAIVKPGGSVIATTPSWLSKPILEFFSYVLGIISKREIDEHKRYFWRSSFTPILKTLERKFGALHFVHHYFEFGLNNFIQITKSSNS